MHRWAVCNRTRANAEAVADLIGGRVAELPPTIEDLAWADIIVSATSSGEPVITSDRMRLAKPMSKNVQLLFDLAVPRDSEPAIAALDTFDRRFDSRENAEMVQGPKSTDDSVWIRWRVTYRVAGAPPFVLEGEETAVMEGDRIRRLEDRFTTEMAAKLEAWMAEHGDKLGTDM